MDGFDAGVTCEVFFVESQNPFHGVHSHGRDQSRVVNLDAGDMVRDQEFSPFLMNGQSVGQEAQLLLKEAGSAAGFQRG
jgi:hypothetical protein